MAKPGPKPGTVNNPKGINQYTSKGPTRRSAVQTSARSAYFNKAVAKDAKRISDVAVSASNKRVLEEVFKSSDIAKAKTDPKFAPFLRETSSTVMKGNPGGMTLRGVGKKDLYNAVDVIAEAEKSRPFSKGPSSRYKRRK